MNKPEMYTYRFRVILETVPATPGAVESIAVPLGHTAQAWERLIKRLKTDGKINTVQSITRIS